MKRKELVEYIYDYLCCDGVLEYSLPKAEICNFTEKHVRHMANDILQLVEDNGMVPPSYQGLMRDGRKFVREWHQGYDVMDIRNAWEPEELEPCGMEPIDVQSITK